jgi:hypothetical protein
VTGRYVQSDPIEFDGGYNTFGYVDGKPIMLSDLRGLDWGKTATYYALIAFAPKINSDFEKRMVHRWIFNEGDYTLSEQEFSEIIGGSTYTFITDGVMTVNTYNMSKYDFAIGRATAYYNTYTYYFEGFYDYFDFDPKAWGVRSTTSELATRAGATFGDISNATPFIIKYP